MAETAIAPLSPQALADRLTTLPHWTYDKERRALYRKIEFRDFGQALAAMVQIGLEAEKADHHPEWFNVYNRLEIWLTTHDADGVSCRDSNLAAIIDRIVQA